MPKLSIGLPLYRPPTLANARTPSAPSLLALATRRLDEPLRQQGTPQRVDQGREVAEVIGEFVALVPQRLNLGLGRRIRNREPADLPIDVAQRRGCLIRTTRC